PNHISKARDAVGPEADDVPADLVAVRVEEANAVAVIAADDVALESLASDRVDANADLAVGHRRGAGCVGADVVVLDRVVDPGREKVDARAGVAADDVARCGGGPTNDITRSRGFDDDAVRVIAQCRSTVRVRADVVARDDVAGRTGPGDVYA